MAPRFTGRPAGETSGRTVQSRLRPGRRWQGPAVRGLPRGWVPVLVVAVVLSAVGTAEKYLGVAGLAGLALYGSVAVPIFLLLSRRLATTLGERASLLLGLATLVALAVAIAVVYPRTDTDDPTRGSDRDDAVRIATTRLLDGEYTYGGLTYQGNPMYELPGAILLAAPFAALGILGAQNLLWLALMFLVLRWCVGAAVLALLAVWLALLSPEFWRELLTGGDIIANAAAVAALVVALVAAHRRGAAGWSTLALAAALGVVLSWRATFLTILPLLFAAIGRSVGWQRSVRSTGTAVAAFAAVTLPFYLARPDEFTPADAGEKLEPYTSVLPYAPVVVPALAFVLAVALAALPGLRDERRVAAAFVPVIAVPHLALVALDSIAEARPSFFQLTDSHGLTWVLFAAVATGLFWGGRAAAGGRAAGRPRY
jgi:hypothetical protein